jgi:hypothetical protein
LRRAEARRREEEKMKSVHQKRTSVDQADDGQKDGLPGGGLEHHGFALSPRVEVDVAAILLLLLLLRSWCRGKVRLERASLWVSELRVGTVGTRSALFRRAARSDDASRGACPRADDRGTF